MGGRTKIYIQTPRWFFRSKNTDWIYTRFTLPRMSEFTPECQFVVARSLATMARTNFSYGYSAFRTKIGKPLRGSHAVIVDLREFQRSGCDVIFCHDDYPGNAGALPVIWQNSILDPEMILAYGVPVEVFERSKEEKVSGFHQASVVQVSTEAERVRLSNWFPEVADKFIAIPFFLPDAKTISAEQLDKKLTHDGPLRCLFVGHQARRKGLARVYDALMRMRSPVRERLQLTVVSAQTDGSIVAPALPNMRVIRGLPHDSVLQLMRENDVFVMPSLFESYGLAYLEAMAQGTIPVVPNWEVQREIVDYGRAGVITSGDPDDLAQKLERLCEDASYRTGLARAARHRFEAEYAPRVVARKFASIATKFSH